MKQLFILFLLVMTQNTVNAQQISESEGKAQIEFARKFINIPSGYVFDKALKTNTDGDEGYLFRYVKEENNQTSGEHFSFIVTESAPFKLLGFTYMDRRFADEKLLSKNETERVAREFLAKVDPQLNADLKNQWIDGHDETIVVDGKPIIVRGMKYKCYSQKNDEYAWLIIDPKGTIITFERDIKWDNKNHRRITEKWLHDNWMQENNKF